MRCFIFQSSATLLYAIYIHEYFREKNLIIKAIWFKNSRTTGFISKRACAKKPCYPTTTFKNWKL